MPRLTLYGDAVGEAAAEDPSTNTLAERKGFHMSAVLLRRKLRKFGEPALQQRLAS
jgi:hypothetical protein